MKSYLVLSFLGNREFSSFEDAWDHYESIGFFGELLAKLPGTLSAYTHLDRAVVS